MSSVCEKLINTKVIFIRTPTCGYSYITSRDGNKKSNWSCICKPPDGIQILCLWLWMETVQIQHIHTPKGENKTAIIVWLTKGCRVDGAASGNNLVRFHSKRLLGKRPIFGSSINPNLPPSRHSCFLIPCHVTTLFPSIIRHNGWVAINCLTEGEPVKRTHSQNNGSLKKLYIQNSAYRTSEK